jgi:hypothetical protein
MMFLMYIVSALNRTNIYDSFTLSVYSFIYCWLILGVVVGITFQTIPLLGIVEG